MKYTIDITANNGSHVKSHFTAENETAALALIESGGVLPDIRNPESVNVYDEQERLIYTDDKFLSQYIGSHCSSDDWSAKQSGNHPPSDEPSVYIDIDGTLAEWNKNATMEEIFDPTNHYFAKIKPEQFVIDLAYQLYLDGVDVCVCGAAARDTIPDKHKWLKEHCPFIQDDHIFFCPLGADKSQFIKGNAEISAAIDDYMPNLRAWHEAGAHAIKCLNGINSHQEEFSEISFEDLKQRQTALHENISHWEEQGVPERVIEAEKSKFASMAVHTIRAVAEAIETELGVGERCREDKKEGRDKA